MQTAQLNRKRQKVPTLESGAAKLLLELTDANVNMDKIIRLVEMSPSIAARLVAISNSAWSNPVAPVTSIAEACNRLGLNVVRTTTIALAIGQSFDHKRCPSFDAERFWCTSMIGSNLASELAPTVNVEPNTARTAALLHNIGLLWLADIMPSETDESLNIANGSPAHTIGECLKNTTGSDRQEASLYLYDAWQLPEALTGGWAESDSQSLASLIPLCESMATEIYAETPLEDSSCPADNGPMCTAYLEQTRQLANIRELAAALF